MFVLAQCFLCMVIDGYDLQVMAYVVPTLIAAADTPKATAGYVFSISMLGMLIGSLVFGSVADRIGRRPVLVISPIVTAVLMYITAHNTNTDALSALRFFIGIAMGAIVPNIAALVMEYAPRRNRVLPSTIVSSGMVVGALGGGCIAAVLVPVSGWQAVFNLGAIAPLCVGILMLFALPESLPWCVLRERQLDRVKIILTQIAPGMQIHEHTHLVLEEARASGLLFSQLFAQGRLSGTLLLWLINFMNMLGVYFLASWSPLLVSDIIHTPFQAVLAAAAIWLGGAGWRLGTELDR